VHPCTLWSLVPAAIAGVSVGIVGALKIWEAREDVFAPPLMIVVMFGLCCLGAGGLWIVVIGIGCLGDGAID
jgi:hypothetical protein